MLSWLRTRDAGLTALRRAARTAIVMPLMFALGTQVLHNANLATFAAFGSFAMLLLADFGGRMRERLLAQLALVLTGGVFVCLGTLVSRPTWLATAAMAAVGFLVLFSGVVSSVLAAASTSVLLSFILPVAQPAPIHTIPDRLAGWLLAGAVSLVAVGLLWPAPARDPLRAAAAEACRLLAARLRLEVAEGLGEPVVAAEREAAVAEAERAVATLRTRFLATPYRPTGLTTTARAVIRLVDEVLWLELILQASGDRRGDPASAQPQVCQVKAATATLLEHCARELGPGQRPGDRIEAHLTALVQARDRMEQAATSTLPVRQRGDTVLVSALEPSFRAHELSFAVTAIAQNVIAAVAAERRSWWQQVLGRQPQGLSGPLTAAQQRAGAHVERHSVWLHNSVRGAIGLGGAVFIADVSGVQHSFWIVLGALSVLRSNALTTGQNVFRGLLGTGAGFIVGGLLVELIGTNTSVLWALLPLAILLAGLAPAVVSFAAGQAAFTVTLLILFNIISPAGWRVGLVRVEDVAIGCAVSLVVGALFWPRGAAAALAVALSEAYRDGADYLQAAVAVGVASCDAVAEDQATAAAEAERAAASARRLDDAFRGFLAERGGKQLSLAQVATLMTGVAGLRLSAEAVLDLWARIGNPPIADRSAAKAELSRAADRVVGWYRTVAAALHGSGAVPDPLPRDAEADGALVTAVRTDLAGDGAQSAIAVRMIWTGEHVDAARRLQAELAAPAATAAAARARLDRLPVLRPAVASGESAG
ncbi:MAG TPA: FUSC family protein [Jatrophihabitans sp.]|nr:FUSC family protein [Jatrophihabitans sp.]